MRIACITSVAVILLGCGGGTMPSARVASAQAAMRAAEEVGARSNPQATLHLRLAHENFDAAQRLIENEDYEVAEGALVRAEADAELALALSRQARAEADARTARDRLQELRGGGR